MAYRLFNSNNKGGTGKTAETVGLAYALAKRGYHVTVADMDPQGNTTRRLGITDELAAKLVADGNYGIAAALDPDTPVPLSEVAVECGWDDPVAKRITVLPSLLVATMERRNKEHGEAGATGRLRRALDAFDGDKHFTLIDGNPSLGHLFDNCLGATDWVIIDAEAEYDGVRGATRVRRWVEDTKVKLGRGDIRIIGAVLHKYDKDRPVHRDNLRDFPAALGPLTVGGQDLPAIDIWEHVPLLGSWMSAQNDGLSPSTITHHVGRQVLDIFDKHADRIIARAA